MDHYHHQKLQLHQQQQPLSPSASFSDCASWRSATPSPPLSESGNSGVWGSVGTDEGIVLDDDYYDEHPRKRKVSITGTMSTKAPARCIRSVCTVVIKKYHYHDVDAFIFII